MIEIARSTRGQKSQGLRGEDALAEPYLVQKNLVILITVLLESRLDENWWADSMECYTYLRNIQDLTS